MQVGESHGEAPHLRLPATLERSGDTEERLLIKLMQLPAKIDPDDFIGYDAGLLTEMEQAAEDGSPLIAATEAA